MKRFFCLALLISVTLSLYAASKNFKGIKELFIWSFTLAVYQVPGGMEKTKACLLGK